MKLTTEIQSLMLDISLDGDEQITDIVLDAQEYAMECILEMVGGMLSEEDIITLDEMIDNDATVDELDTWLATKVPNYETYIAQAIGIVKDYLAGEEEIPETQISL